MAGINPVCIEPLTGRHCLGHGLVAPVLREEKALAKRTWSLIADGGNPPQFDLVRFSRATGAFRRLSLFQVNAMRGGPV
jgi:hypothetical protein